MKKLIVIGAGGLAKEVVWLAQECGYQIFGLLDDNTQMLGQQIMGAKVLGTAANWVDYSDCHFIIAIGSPRIRYVVHEKMLQTAPQGSSPQFATLIHPSVIKSSSVSIGEGSIIFPGCVLTVEVSIGRHTVLNPSNTVSHESSIGDFVTLAPMAAIAGNVTLEDFTEVGIGAAIRQGLTIAQGGMLGMGGVQTKDIPENTVFVGNPAKPLKTLPAVETKC
ncbi:MAG: acetyltransferase [Colwelliaceae bacterium]|nr:acetyltransferase [Colwelliaceae bacterium]